MYNERDFQRIADELAHSTGEIHTSALGIGNYDMYVYFYRTTIANSVEIPNPAIAISIFQHFRLSLHFRNVVELALQKQGLYVQWFDQNKFALPNALLQPFDHTDLIGLIVNVQSTNLFTSFLSPAKGEHFFALRRFSSVNSTEEVWVNLDSRLRSSQSFPSPQSVIKFLETLPSRHPPHILQVYRHC